MANYDFQLAKLIINTTPNIARALMGMHEDWFWTAEYVWKDGEYTMELNDETLIGGINGSYWATPVLQIVFKDGTQKTYKCYTGQMADDLKSKLLRIEKEMEWASGVLSEPVQRERDNISLEDITTKQ